MFRESGCSEGERVVYVRVRGIFRHDVNVSEATEHNHISADQDQADEHLLSGAKVSDAAVGVGVEAAPNSAEGDFAVLRRSPRLPAIPSTTDDRAQDLVTPDVDGAAAFCD